jgi:hypothetical protein
MVSIEKSQLAQLTARAGVGRAGTCRAGAAPKSYELKANGTGEIIWDRPVATDGEPDDTPAVFTTERE